MKNFSSISISLKITSNWNHLLVINRKKFIIWMNLILENGWEKKKIQTAFSFLLIYELWILASANWTFSAVKPNSNQISKSSYRMQLKVLLGIVSFFIINDHLQFCIHFRQQYSCSVLTFFLCNFNRNIVQGLFLNSNFFFIAFNEHRFIQSTF